MYHKFFIPALFFLLLGFSQFTVYSQKDLKVMVRAENGPVFFYLKGEKKDSIVSKNKSLFYLVCKESQKKNILFYIENARFKTTDNDSMVQLEYLPGLKYEAWYVNSNDSTNTNEQAGKLTLTSFLNGTSLLEKTQIKVQIYFRKENEPVLENLYYYRD